MIKKYLIQLCRLLVCVKKTNPNARAMQLKIFAINVAHGKEYNPKFAIILEIPNRAKLPKPPPKNTAIQFIG